MEPTGVGPALAGVNPAGSTVKPTAPCFYVRMPRCLIGGFGRLPARIWSSRLRTPRSWFGPGVFTPRPGQIFLHFGINIPPCVRVFRNPRDYIFFEQLTHNVLNFILS